MDSKQDTFIYRVLGSKNERVGRREQEQRARVRIKTTVTYRKTLLRDIRTNSERSYLAGND